MLQQVGVKRRSCWLVGIAKHAANSVHVRSLENRVTRERQSIEALLVGQDEKKIGLLLQEHPASDVV